MACGVADLVAQPSLVREAAELRIQVRHYCQVAGGPSAPPEHSPAPQVH
jgi:hypothetical protein